MPTPDTQDSPNPAAGRPLYRTVMTVEILGEEPFNGDFEDVAEACVSGPFSGMVADLSSEKVDAATMADLLVAQGSDPSFLGLTQDSAGQWVALPFDEVDAIECPHGKRVWAGSDECADCLPEID